MKYVDKPGVFPMADFRVPPAVFVRCKNILGVFLFSFCKLSDLILLLFIRQFTFTVHGPRASSSPAFQPRCFAAMLAMRRGSSSGGTRWR